LFIYLAMIGYDENSACDFNSIYETCHPIVWKFISARTKHEDAEDIVQNVFTALFKRKEIFPTMYDAKLWLYTVAHNAFNKFWENSKKAEVYNIVSLEDENVHNEASQIQSNELSDDLIKLEWAMIMQQYLSELKPIHHDVVKMYYLEGYEAEEIAKRLGIPKNTVYSRLKRARKILKEKMYEGGNKND